MPVAKKVYKQLLDTATKLLKDDTLFEIDEDGKRVMKDEHFLTVLKLESFADSIEYFVLKDISDLFDKVVEGIQLLNSVK